MALCESESGIWGFWLGGGDVKEDFKGPSENGLVADK